MPIRVQHFRLRLMRFSYSIYHVPGKDICTADTLCRAPVLTEDHTAEAFHKEVNTYVNLLLIIFQLLQSGYRRSNVSKIRMKPVRNLNYIVKMGGQPENT